VTSPLCHTPTMASKSSGFQLAYSAWLTSPEWFEKEMYKSMGYEMLADWDKDAAGNCSNCSQLHPYPSLPTSHIPWTCTSPSQTIRGLCTGVFRRLQKGRKQRSLLTGIGRAAGFWQSILGLKPFGACQPSRVCFAKSPQPGRCL
jgi:hypothetical protein